MSDCSEILKYTIFTTVHQFSLYKMATEIDEKLQPKFFGLDISNDKITQLDLSLNIGLAGI